MGIAVPVRLRSIEAAVMTAHGRMRSLSVDEIDALDATASTVTNQIEEEWPVDTSTSRDGFYFTIQSAPGNYGFTVLNDVDYVQYIHAAGTPAKPELWRTLIPRIVAEHLTPLLSRLRAAIADTERALAAEAAKPKGQRLSEAQVLSRSWRGRKAA